MAQGYVTEIMITLDANVLHMEVAEHSLINFFRRNLLIVNSTANAETPNCDQRNSPTHQRSVSQSIAIMKRSEKKGMIAYMTFSIF